MTDNERRAARAYAALRDYVVAKGEMFEESSSEIVDLITDLLHLAAKWDLGDDPIDSALRLAKLHFEAEAGELETTSACSVRNAARPIASTSPQRYGSAFPLTVPTPPKLKTATTNGTRTARSSAVPAVSPALLPASPKPEVRHDRNRNLPACARHRT